MDPNQKEVLQHLLHAATGLCSDPIQRRAILSEPAADLSGSVVSLRPEKILQKMLQTLRGVELLQTVVVLTPLMSRDFVLKSVMS